MSITVNELCPGDKVKLGDKTAIFISAGTHPKYIALQLVIWKLDTDEWSLDALASNQEVGELIPTTPQQRWIAIQEAFGWNNGTWRSQGNRSSVH